MFPGKRAAIMLNPLSLLAAPYIVGEPFPFPIAFADQVRIGRYLRTENTEELYVYLYLYSPGSLSLFSTSSIPRRAVDQRAAG